MNAPLLDRDKRARFGQVLGRSPAELEALFCGTKCIECGRARDGAWGFCLKCYCAERVRLGVAERDQSRATAPNTRATSEDTDWDEPEERLKELRKRIPGTVASFFGPKWGDADDPLDPAFYGCRVCECLTVPIKDGLCVNCFREGERVFRAPTKRTKGRGR